MLKQAAMRNNVTVIGDRSRPVLLLAHGFGCDQDMWRRVVPALAADHCLVLFDHVGAGSSDTNAYADDKYATLDGYAGDVVEICDELGLCDVTLVGHSVSAMIALIAAASRPELFDRLILVAPSPCYIDDPGRGYVGGFTREDIDGLLSSLESNYFAWAAAIAPMVMGATNGPALGSELAGSFCKTNPDIASKFARVTFLSDTRPILDRVSTPALILQCSDDMLAPVDVGEYLHRHLACSSLVQLRATGHCPHVSAPAETVAAMLQYLTTT